MRNAADETDLVSFDEDSYYQDPAGFFAWLRESRPVAPVRMRSRGRAWFITRYADVWVPLADPPAARRNRTIQIQAGRQAITAARSLPGDLRHALETVNRASPGRG